MVHGLIPHTLSEEPPVLGCEVLVHPLHRVVDAVGEVIKSFFDIYNPPPSLGHGIEAHISLTTSFSHRVYHYAPFMIFNESLTTIISLFPFLPLLILGKLFSLIHAS